MNNIRKIWNVERYSFKARFDGLKTYSGLPLWKVKLRNEIKHAIFQNLRDQKRRGKSNREGSNNKSYRKKKRAVIFSCVAFEVLA